MSKEVMKLALEALENGEYYIDDLEAIVYAADDLGTHEDRAKMQEAITALREAIAHEEPTAWVTAGSHTVPLVTQPAQQALDKMAENAREIGLDYEPSQTDWEAVAADQAMTIALLKADQPAQQKPVAWILKCGEQQELWWEKPFFGDAIPLYTKEQL